MEAFAYLGEAFTILFSIATLALIVVTLPSGIDTFHKKVSQWYAHRKFKRELHHKVDDPQPGDYKTEIPPPSGKATNRFRREVTPQEPPAIEDDP